MANTAKVSFILLFFLPGLYLNAQNKDDLEKQKNDILEQIEMTNKVLSETQNNKKATLNEFRTLESKINSRNNLIRTIQHEINATDSTIESNKKNLEQLNIEINQLQSEYSVLLKSALRQKLTRNKLLYFLSSKSINEVLIKWRYTKQFEAYARQKAIDLDQAISQLATGNLEIQQRRGKKQTLLTEEKSHNSLLQNELKEKDQMLSVLEQNEKRLREELKTKRQESSNLNNTISSIIKSETIDKKPVSPNNSIDNDNEEPESLHFGDLIGKLEWPIEKGIVNIKFGRQKHPSLKNISITNNGIDVITDVGAEVYSVFDGVVSGQAFIPGYNNMLVIRHGAFRSVYAKMELIYVKKGQQVEQGQLLGKLAIEENKSELHFEIWQGDQKKDPEKWLKPK